MAKYDLVKQSRVEMRLDFFQEQEKIKRVLERKLVLLNLEFIKQLLIANFL